MDIATQLPSLPHHDEHQHQQHQSTLAELDGAIIEPHKKRRMSRSEGGSKDPTRVEAGRKAAQTRKQREGADVFSRLGQRGQEARQMLGHEALSKISQQAADTRRGREGVDVFRKMGHKGQEQRRQLGHEKLSEISQHAAETRREREGEDVFAKMGRKGGEAKSFHSE